MPPPPPGTKAAVSNKWYYEDRECDVPDHKNPEGHRACKMMGTPSGKIEFVSTFLQEHFPMTRSVP